MAKTDILSALNLNKNELQNPVLHNLAAAPDTPKKGQVYFDSAANKVKYYNGTKWVDSVSTEEMNTALGDKVDKVSGKQLSTNDFTNDYKSKVDGIASGAQVNVIESVKVNGTAQAISAKSVNITVPTKTSQLTNDSSFATQTYVNQQIGAIDKLKKSIVSALPSSNIDANTIYLVPKSSTESGNYYDEYMYINGKWELIGNSKTDMTGFVKKQTYQNPALTPSGGVVTWTVTHTLNSQDVCATLRRVSDNAQILCEIVFASSTQVVVKMNASANVAANAYKLVLIG